ncbi:MAG: IS1634 family transposase [Polyangia bacterium]
MYIHTIPNRNSPPAILLRESYRENGKTKNKTITNISHWPPDRIEGLRRLLKGEKLISVDDAFEKVSSLQHGHVKAVLSAMERLGFAKLLASRRSRQRNIVAAMVAWRIIKPDSKLAMQRTWKDTTLPAQLGIEGADEDDLYAAMDWLVERQERIEKKLARRHLTEGGLVMYDLSSSYFEGTKCKLAKLGHNRDGKKGKLQVNYGLLTDQRGCPVSVSVFDGNTGDPKTLLPQAEKVRTRFGVGEMVLVGDRGMISQKQIDALKETDGVAWLTALKTGAIRSLTEGGCIQLGLFDERGLFELEHPDYPGERLVACRNPELAKLRAHKRESLLAATAKELEKVRRTAGKGKLKTAAAIGVRAGKVVNKYKVAKHFDLDIRDDAFGFAVNEASVTAEAALDGIYVVRTSVPATRMDADDVVRSYKNLSRVERAFRSLKTVDLKVRPIHHHDEERVRAHIFLCMLAYYVEWHMREALRPLLFEDEDQEAKATRDPVAPAKRSGKALEKIATKRTEDDLEAHSFRTLIDHLGGIVRNSCKRKGDGEDAPADVIIETTPDPIQQRAFDLISQLAV